jgi:voltage-gated potassium channel
MDVVLPARGHRHAVIVSVVRWLGCTVALFVLYSLAPLDEKPTHFVAFLELAFALAALVTITTWQIVLVARSPYPRLRAFEAIGISAPLLVILFASTYVSMDAVSPQSFNESLTKIDGIYFTVTALATVGFGDIAAASQTARVLVTVQMIIDLIFIGVVAKVLVGVTQKRVQELASAVVVIDEEPT